MGPPALYAVVAMGGVFAAAAQAPLTAVASVAEMTGNFGITLPIMLTCAIAAAVSKHLSYGSVYTTKLLRRGIDIERQHPLSAANHRSPSRQQPDTRRPAVPASVAIEAAETSAHANQSLTPDIVSSRASLSTVED